MWCGHPHRRPPEAAPRPALRGHRRHDRRRQRRRRRRGPGADPGWSGARSVLPAPGGPISSSAWSPARAISSARRATTWPRHVGEVDRRCRGCPGAGGQPDLRPVGHADDALAAAPGRGRLRPRRPSASAASPTHATGTGSTPGDEAGLRRRPAGTRIRVAPWSPSARHIGRIPGTRRTSPPSPSSPIRATRPARRPELLRPQQDADGDREVERRAGLAELRGREVDGDPARRVVEAGVAKRAADAFARLRQRRVGQPDDREARQARRHVDLDADDPSGDAVEGGGEQRRKHDAHGRRRRSSPRLSWTHAHPPRGPGRARPSAFYRPAGRQLGDRAVGRILSIARRSPAPSGPAPSPPCRP